MKGSSVISARATTAPRPTGQSSAKLRPTPTNAEEFALSGPSSLPDPRLHAYRKDLADVALAGRVISSHYAKPVARTIAVPTTLREAPSNEAEALCELVPGDSFALLDDSMGWAWGYAGGDQRVGYVKSSALASA